MKKIIFVLIVSFNFVGYSQPQFLTRSQLEKWIESSEKYTYTGDRNIFRVFVRHKATMIREAYEEKDSPIFEQIVNAFAEHLQFEKEYEHNDFSYSSMHLPYRYNEYYWKFMEVSNIPSVLKNDLQYSIFYRRDEEIEELYIYRGADFPCYILESRGGLKEGFPIKVYSNDEYR